MDLQRLCKNCMQAMVKNGICPCCGARQGAEQGKDPRVLPPGRILHGQYILGRTIGVGGFGITYLAYDLLGNHRVALKELFPCKDVVRDIKSGDIRVLQGQESYFSHVKQRFLEEAEALFRFRNIPDVVNVYRFFEENHTAYYCMEFLEGTDLKHYLMQHGKLEWEKLSGYIRMVLRALHALHRQNLIHRDISPDNIFLTKDGRAVLIDFGSVRSCSNNGGFTTFLKDCFAPWEQYRENTRQGPWTDIYSLCITMYYVLSGTLPQKAPDRLQDDKTVYIGTLCPELPRHVAAAITRGMELLQEKRFQNVQELSAALFPGEELWSLTGRRTAGQGIQGNDSRGSGDPKAGSNVSRRGSSRGSENGRGTGRPLEWGLVCRKGYYAGRHWRFKPGVPVVFGREPRCTVPYPPDDHRISRKQCSVMLDRQGRLYVRDEKSTNGTFLNQRALPPSVWQQVTKGAYISFAQELYQVI